MKAQLKKVNLHKAGKLYDYAFRALYNADPRISNFHVGAAGFVVGQSGKSRIVSGWNQEINNGDSIHAEESMIAKLRKGELLTRIVILGGNGAALAPCGNCREVLVSRSAGNAKVLINIESGIKWLPVKDLLPNSSNCERTDVASLTKGDDPTFVELLKLYYEAYRIMNDKPYNPHTGKLQAAAVWADKRVFAATGKEDAGRNYTRPRRSAGLILR